MSLFARIGSLANASPFDPRRLVGRRAIHSPAGQVPLLEIGQGGGGSWGNLVGSPRNDDGVKSSIVQLRCTTQDLTPKKRTESAGAFVRLSD